MSQSYAKIFVMQYPLQLFLFTHFFLLLAFMEIKENELLMPAHFAKIIGVNPSSVTRKRDKLKTETKFGKWLVVYCPENIELFRTSKGCGNCNICVCGSK